MRLETLKILAPLSQLKHLPWVSKYFYTENGLTYTVAKNMASYKEVKHSSKFDLICSLAVLTGTSSLFYDKDKPRPKENFDEFQETHDLLRHCQNLKDKVTEFVKNYRELPRRSLLPDPLLPPYKQPKYTLVIEPKAILYHAVWSYEKGWHFLKRPGVDEFLETVDKSNYEIVLFTEVSGDKGHDLVQALDENKHAFYYLFKDSTQLIGNHHVKNLNSLNRDLTKVIALDVSIENLKETPRNSFILNPWEGELDDCTLPYLANFLAVISMMDVDDVRPILEYYSSFKDPLEVFQENKRKLMMMLGEKEQKKKQMNKPSSPFEEVTKWRANIFYR